MANTDDEKEEHQMDLITKHTMTDAQYCRWLLWKQLPTTLQLRTCQACGRMNQVFIYNHKVFCRGCIDSAIAKRLGILIINGGNNEPVDQTKWLNSTKKRSHRRLPIPPNGAA